MGKRRPARGGATAKASEQITRELAAAALRKRQAGQKPTGQELAALRKVEREREREQRWEYYSTVPKADYCELAGRQAKVVLEQADRYGLPLRGRTVDLAAVLKAFHDLLAENKHRLARAGEAKQDADSIDWQEEYRKYKALKAELDLDAQKRVVLPRATIHEALAEFAGLLRSAGDRLARQFGSDALEILSEALDGCEAVIDRLFPEDEKA